MLFTDVSSERAVSAFKKVGFWILRQGKHLGMTNGTRKIIIPRHNRVNPHTLKGIIRDAGLTDEEFKKLI
ncbi:type II toxin-antitoxin system HicA family toxin [Patescibacteria group bacterium]|nr:type II toxin-antitoxin system HicA family toxin [Patescibacteria group bacterium]